MPSSSPSIASRWVHPAGCSCLAASSTCVWARPEEKPGWLHNGKLLQEDTTARQGSVSTCNNMLHELTAALPLYTTFGCHGAVPRPPRLPSAWPRCLYTTQTRMQVFSTQPAAIYTGMTQAFSRISSTEGASRLWRGVWSVILGAGPAHAVYFGTYETVKDLAGGNRAGHQFAATGAFRSVSESALARAKGS